MAGLWIDIYYLRRYNKRYDKYGESLPFTNELIWNGRWIHGSIYERVGARLGFNHWKRSEINRHFYPGSGGKQIIIVFEQNMDAWRRW